MNNQAFLLQMIQKFRQGATGGWSRVWGRLRGSRADHRLEGLWGLKGG